MRARRVPIARPTAAARQLGAASARALRAAEAAEATRGRDIVILDVRESTTLFDYFVLVTGTSRRQLHAISDEIDRVLQEMGDQRLGTEGYGESRWILLDYGDIVFHLFDDETRRYYALEDLWAQAKRVPFESRSSTPESRQSQSQ